MRQALGPYSLLLILSLGLLCGKVSGQDGPENHNLSFRLKSLNFAVNNEFFNPIDEGYTMLGFFLQPELIYSPSSRLTLRGGGHFLMYDGTGKFSKIRPVFSTTLNLTGKTSLTLGTLSGADRHAFLDPHFHWERMYNEYIEDGIQVTHKSDHFFSDTWVSWEHYIFRGDSAREQFTMGESFRYTSRELADFITIEIPFQFQAKHRGGQISNYSEGMESFFNVAAGARINMEPGSSRLGKLGLEYLVFLNSQRKGDTITGINHGRGTWLRLHYKYKAFGFSTGYWDADDFYAPNGNPIFGSVSDYKPGLVIHRRQLYTASANIRFTPVTSLELYFGIDLYYDPALKRLDQAYALHLDFDRIFSLASRKRTRELHE